MWLKKHQLAKRLHLSRPTLDIYLAKEGAPVGRADGSYQFGEVAKFVEDNAKSEKVLAGSSGSFAELKKDELIERIKKLRLANEHIEGNFVPLKQVEADRSSIVNAIFGAFREQVSILIPELDGRDGPGKERALLNSWETVAKEIKEKYGSRPTPVG